MPAPRFTSTVARFGHLSLVAAVAVVVAPGCGTDDVHGDARVGERRDAIVNGQPDTSRQAVVLVATSGQQASICSGTIVKKDEQTGAAWVLTAAHCVASTPTLVVQANDYEARDAVVYPVVDAVADPTYQDRAGSPGDLAIVRVLGAGRDTPVIPLATSPDGVQVGTSIVDVGYGRTTPLDEQPDANTLRRNFTTRVAQLDAQFVGVSSNAGGICSGDSGGPSLVGAPGSERVVAVHSYVQGTCDRGAAFSARVTSRLAWIQGELAKAPAVDGCTACLTNETAGERECGKLDRACRADTSCARYADCMAGCGTSAQCRSSCYLKHPQGEAAYELVLECACNGACEASCGSTGVCRSVPTCGERYRAEGQAAGEAEACAACADAKCCDALAACSRDDGCHGCLRPGGGEQTCEATAPKAALDACVRDGCAAECGLAPAAPIDETAGTADAGPAASASAPAAATSSGGCAAAPSPNAGHHVPVAFGLALAALGARLRRRSGARAT